MRSPCRAILAIECASVHVFALCVIVLDALPGYLRSKFSFLFTPRLKALHLPPTADSSQGGSSYPVTLVCLDLVPMKKKCERVYASGAGFHPRA
jgi:hypothetical protein